MVFSAAGEALERPQTHGLGEMPMRAVSARNASRVAQKNTLEIPPALGREPPRHG